MIATKKEKTIISKDPKKLTEKEKSYHYIAKHRVRNKTRQAFQDLEWLAQKYPAALNQEPILKFLGAYLSQPAFHITTEERTRALTRTGKIIPLHKTIYGKTMRRKDVREVLQVGDVRDKDGAPLKKWLGKGAFFCVGLLQLIHSAFSTDAPFGKVKIWRFQPKEDGKLDLKFDYDTVEEKAYPKNWLVFILENPSEGS
jgi:hypothetical protein